MGAYPCVLKKGTRAFENYGEKEISERHRHRYEFNNAFREQLENKGLVISGTSPDNSLVEMVELKDHPWFVAVQFHPEFKSRPMLPHPLFFHFIEASLEYAAQKNWAEKKVQIQQNHPFKKVGSPKMNQKTSKGFK